MSKAIVIFSGGQDSTTILGQVLHLGHEAIALSFDYGQKHAIELNQAHAICEKLGVRHEIIDVTHFGQLIGAKTALVNKDMSVNESTPLAHMGKDIPASFVPNRNALMLTIAHAFAQTEGAESVWAGMCQTDYSGYPDCRDAFVKSLRDALNLGYQSSIQFITPLMWLTKGETFKLAEEVGILDTVIEDSHTCYNGKREDNQVPHPTISYRHEWGHGCGECPACQLRAKGWADYKAMVRVA